MKEHSDLEPIVMKYREYTNVLNSIKESKEILQEESDEELRELAKMELSELEDQVEPLESELKILLLPKDPNDEKNVIVEIRGGAGGDEAALFAGDLFRMYSRYAERRRWKMELLIAHRILQLHTPVLFQAATMPPVAHAHPAAREALKMQVTRLLHAQGPR